MAAGNVLRSTLFMLILIVVYTLNFLDRQILGILAVPIQAELRLTDGQLGLMGGLAFAVLYSTLGVPIAWLADRWSRAWIMTIALTIWSGFTAVCAMPNTDPVTDNQAAVGFIVRQALRARAARVYPIGAVSVGQKGEALAEFGEMVGAGAVAVSDDGRPVASAQLMRTALEYARTFSIPVADHCEEPTLASGGAMNEGVVSARLGLKGIPAEAEEIMAIRDILLARRTGGHVHLCHMSTRGSVDLIRWGKERGIRVTAEVCPQHLSLTEDAVGAYDTNAKMNPPLRTADDVAALQEAVRDGTIDLVATDHAPHHYDEKEREFADAPNGIVGLETALAVVVTHLVVPGILSWGTLVDRMATTPARVFGLPGGTLRTGSVADVTVFDPALAWTVDPVRFLSKGRNSPYRGKRLTGRATCTVVGGRVVHRDGGGGTGVRG